MTKPALTDAPRLPAAGRRGLADVLLHVLDRICAWQERRRQRWILASLDDNALKDVGLTRADVAWEVSKPFWRG
jgi:uncharacterized protein YjiS (DUF1127 family)